MRQNQARRAVLLDAALGILAREGSRGLTYRTLDAEAEMPTGTASNYFRNRAELLRQAGQHVHSRLRPDPEWLQQVLSQPPGQPLMTDLLQNLVQRVLKDKTAYLALLELRLEAMRHPELRATLFQTVQQDLLDNQAFGPAHGMSLPDTDFVLIYLAVTGLLIQELTLPGVLGEQTPERLVQRLVEVFMPAG